ncbi:MAG: hypothetical protein HC842_07145 [Cytophagales bacterium]|nr:hypothetical protein [Cytophagales bacterium]
MPDLAARFKQKQGELNLFLAATMQTNRAMLFDREGSYNGHEKWEPLKIRKGMILSDRGNLRRSIAPAMADGRPGPGGFVRFQGNVVTLGTALKYAPIQNFGGVVRAKNVEALKIPLGRGRFHVP